MPLTDAEIRDTYGKRLKEARLAKGYTQHHMATLLSDQGAVFVTPQAVSRWENGAASPRPWIRPAVAKVPGFDVDVLFAIPTDDDEAAA